MTRSDRSLPPLLAALHAVKHQIDVDADNRAENDEDDDERIDYEAYPEFESAARTEFAATHAAAHRKSAHEVLARARAEFGARFEAEVRARCQ